MSSTLPNCHMWSCSCLAAVPSRKYKLDLKWSLNILQTAFHMVISEHGYRVPELPVYAKTISDLSFLASILYPKRKFHLCVISSHFYNVVRQPFSTIKTIANPLYVKHLWLTISMVKHTALLHKVHVMLFFIYFSTFTSPRCYLKGFCFTVYSVSYTHRWEVTSPLLAAV